MENLQFNHLEGIELSPSEGRILTGNRADMVLREILMSKKGEKKLHQLREETNISMGLLSRLANGKVRRTSLQNKIKLLDAFNISLSDFQLAIAESEEEDTDDTNQTMITPRLIDRSIYETRSNFINQLRHLKSFTEEKIEQTILRDRSDPNLAVTQDVLAIADIRAEIAIIISEQEGRMGLQSTNLPVN